MRQPGDHKQYEERDLKSRLDGKNISNSGSKANHSRGGTLLREDVELAKLSPCPSARNCLFIEAGLPPDPLWILLSLGAGGDLGDARGEILPKIQLFTLSSISCGFVGKLKHSASSRPCSRTRSIDPPIYSYLRHPSVSLRVNKETGCRKFTRCLPPSRYLALSILHF